MTRPRPPLLDDEARLPAQFARHVQQLLATPRKAVRRAWVQPVRRAGDEAFVAAIAEAVARLHQAHAWAGPGGRNSCRLGWCGGQWRQPSTRRARWRSGFPRPGGVLSRSGFSHSAPPERTAAGFCSTASAATGILVADPEIKRLLAASAAASALHRGGHAREENWPRP